MNIIIVDNKPIYKLFVEKTTTIGEIKNLLKQYNNLRFFLNNKDELVVFNTDKYDKLKFETFWDKLNNPKIFIEHNSQNKYLTGIKDLDEKVLNYLSDPDILNMFTLNKTFAYRVCDDNFFHRLVISRYHETMEYRRDESWKKFFYKMSESVLKLETINYIYKKEDLNPYLLNEIFKYTIGGPDKNNVTELLENLTNYRIDFVKYLMKRGANIYSEIYENICYHANVETIRYVTDSINNAFRGDVDPIENAFNAKNFSVVEYLIENGFPVDYNDNEMLIISCQKYKLEFVEFLINHGANVGAEDNEPLMRACNRKDSYDFVKLLLNNGADATARNNQAVINAASKMQYDSIKLLIERGGNIRAQSNKALFIASDKRNYKMMEFLLKNGADVNSRNGEVLLDNDSDLKTLKMLLNHGCDINIRNGALMKKALKLNDEKLVEFLLKNNAQKAFK